jgi:hypothetical protein
LILHAVLCTYGFILGCAILYGEVVKKNLRNITFTTGTGDSIEATWLVLFQYFMQSMQSFVSVLLLCFVCAIMLFIFYAYHLLLISRGQTTNESVKQSHYRKNIRQFIEFLEAYLATFGADGKQEYRPTKENLEFF